MMKTKEGRKIKAFHVIVYIILILGVSIVILPFVWMVLTSLKTQTEAVHIPVTVFPSIPHFETYAEVFKRIPFFRMFLNTLLSSVVAVIGQCVICSFAAFSFAKLRFPGKNFIFILILGILMIPGSAYILPQYLLVQKMKLLNTITVLWLPKLFSAYGTFMMRQYFLSLPNALMDAAKIDGCNFWQIYSKVYFPLSKTGLVTLGIITFKYAWNDLMWPLIVNTSQSKMTLSAGLSYMAGQYEVEYPLMMAGAVMAVIPLLIVFIIFQNQFIEGVATTGIKG